MLAQQLANGIVSGSIYALFALGFTLMFGVLGVINLTYGVYFSAGAMAALLLATWAKLPIALSVALASAAVGAAAVVVDGLLLTPLRRARAPELASLMVTLGATLFLYSVASAWLGTDIRRFPSAIFSGAVFHFGAVRISESQIIIIAAALLAVAALMLLMQTTRLGLAIRAVAENEDAAEMMGVNSLLVTRIVSFLSGSLGALAGVLIGLNSDAIEPYMGESMMLKGFAVIVLGGLGDVRGALIAGLLMGVVETLTAGYFSSSLKDAVGFVLLVLTLWIRPSGLLGRTTVKRA